MIRLFTFVLFLASTSLVLAQAPAAPAKKAELDLSTPRLKASYAIGLTIGKSLKNDGLEVDVATLAEGLKVSLEGTKPKFTPAQINEAITVFQQEMRVKLLANRTAEGEKNKVAGKAFLAKNGKQDGIVTLESGLQYQILKSGDGKRPKATDRVSAHYHGTLLDGTVFDSSVEREEPLEIGVSGVIKGWTEALLLMQVGDKWRLFVPSNLAYADRGAGSDIGPHATLIFEVELLEIK
jgi:FKBP-type peptidyl-prolyl cis-trans isomerase